MEYSSCVLRRQFWWNFCRKVKHWRNVSYIRHVRLKMTIDSLWSQGRLLAEDGCPFVSCEYGVYSSPPEAELAYNYFDQNSVADAVTVWQFWVLSLRRLEDLLLLALLEDLELSSQKSILLVRPHEDSLTWP